MSWDWRQDWGISKPRSYNKEALATQRVQAACKSLAEILLEISLVLMILLSSSPPLWSSWHIFHLPDAGSRASPCQAVLQWTNAFYFLILTLLLYCRDDTRLVFTWGFPITGFVQRPFSPSFVGHTQDSSSLPCCSYSCVWTCAL